MGYKKANCIRLASGAVRALAPAMLRITDGRGRGRQSGGSSGEESSILIIGQANSSLI